VRGRKRKAALWIASIVGAVVLGWMASSRLPLWPERWVVPAPVWLWIGIAAYLPYVWIRAERIRRLLEAELEDGQGLSSALVQGSGWVSFLAVIALPFRLGEFSRPILLARAERPGLGFPEALTAQAVEKILDGLTIVGLLFAGLALSSPAGEELNSVREVGRWMTALFGVGLVVLLVFSRMPEKLGKLTRALIPGAAGDKLGDFAERVAASLQPLWRPSVGGVVLVWTGLYWAITVLQLWAVARGFGLGLSVAASAAVVAIVGLSIQLPGGPAQLGSFQLGMTGALLLYVDMEAGDALLAAAGFSAGMYLLQLVGALLFAAPGAWMLQREAAKSPDA
jgi:uncharacterized membrane protein YbhN (UPF0104 family)